MHETVERAHAAGVARAAAAAAERGRAASMERAAAAALERERVADMERAAAAVLERDSAAAVERDRAAAVARAAAAAVERARAAAVERAAAAAVDRDRLTRANEDHAAWLASPRALAPLGPPLGCRGMSSGSGAEVAAIPPPAVYPQRRAWQDVFQVFANNALRCARNARNGARISEAAAGAFLEQAEVFENSAQEIMNFLTQHPRR